MSLAETLSKLHDVLRALIGESAEEWASQKQSTDFNSDYEWAQHLLFVHRECCHNDCCRLKSSIDPDSHSYTVSESQYVLPSVPATRRVPIHHTSGSATASTLPRRRMAKFHQKRLNSRIKLNPNRTPYQLGSQRAKLLDTSGPSSHRNKPTSTVTSSVQIKQETPELPHHEDDDVVIIQDDRPHINHTQPPDDTYPPPPDDTYPMHVVTYPPQDDTYTPVDDSWDDSRIFMPQVEAYPPGWEYQEGGDTTEGDLSMEREPGDNADVNVKTEDETVYYAEDESGEAYEPVDNEAEQSAEKMPFSSWQSWSSSRFNYQSLSVLTDDSRRRFSTPSRQNFAERKTTIRDGTTEMYLEPSNGSNTHDALSNPFVERSYMCDICNRVFSTRQRLSVHTRIHTGERPYRCSVCGKDFSQINNLYRHTRTVH